MDVLRLKAIEAAVIKRRVKGVSAEEWREIFQAASYSGATGLVTCSFCSRSQSEVRVIIAGNPTAICEECSGACREIVAEYDQGQAGRT